MKLYETLIKLILKRLECHEGAFLVDPEIPPFTDDQVAYHIRLCHDAGFVRLNDQGFLRELTWHGQQELARLRKESLND